MKTTIKSVMGIALLFLLSQNVRAQIASRVLAPASMLRELSIIKSSWVNLHPGLYRFNSQEDIELDFRKANLFAQKPRSEAEYYIYLAQLTAKLNCGHTYLNPWNQDNVIKNELYSKSYIPFLFQIIDHHFIITHNLSEIVKVKAGDEIVSLNGIPMEQIIDSLLTVSQTDGKHGMPRKMDNLNVTPLDIDTSNYALFDIFFPLFFPHNFNTSRYDIIIKPYLQPAIHISARALSKAERQQVYVTRFGTIPLHEKNWIFKFINVNTAYFRIGDFETWEWKTDYKRYLDSIFTALHQAGSKNLIIDIRGNGGGDDEARDEVLSYLTDKEFGCDNPMRRLYKFLVIPDTLIPYLKTWNKDFKTHKDTTRYIQTQNGYFEMKDDINSPCQPIAPKPNSFKGHKFLITNANNSSTTFTMANLFQQLQMGTIVGEVTGGTKQGINGGQFFFLELPDSRIEIDLPIIWGAPTIEQPDEGVQPDRIIKTSQADICNGNDAQLNYILSNLQ